ncbi:MAG: carbohydrate kinase, partial [Saprospiraceae bacterium]|nr:carbohydrate kinase [Saprospiraceae bacterium]
FRMLQDLGFKPKQIRVGNDNLFRSKVFSTTLSNLIKTPIQVVKTSGAVGAAKAAGIGCGIYSSLEEAFDSLEVEKEYIPEDSECDYENAFKRWEKDLEILIGKSEA